MQVYTIAITTTLIKYGEKYFSLHDAKGDGNCLYHSIVNSEMLNIKNHTILRMNTTESILNMHEEDSQTSVMIENIFDSYRHDFNLK